MIRLENVYKTYSAGNTALDGIDLQIDKGEFVFIVGPSGSGKTTLFKLLVKELEPTSGAIFMNGQNIRRLRKSKVPKMRRGIGVVFQDFRLLKDRTVYENIAFAQRVVGKSTSFIKQSVPKLLDTVGLSDKADARPYELSGGEQQRVALARALANNPPVLLADEPTGNLDPDNAWSIMQLLDNINKKGTTVIVVTHNHEIVDRMNKRVVAMQNGIITNDTKNSTEDNASVLSKIEDMKDGNDVAEENDMVIAGTKRRMDLSKFDDTIDELPKVTESNTDVLDLNLIAEMEGILTEEDSVTSEIQKLDDQTADELLNSMEDTKVNITVEGEDANEA